MKLRLSEKHQVLDKVIPNAQVKTLNKAVSPKNAQSKGLAGWKNQKDLQRTLPRNSQKPETGVVSQAHNNEILENGDRKTQKPVKEVILKSDSKGFVSSKMPNQLNSPKSQTINFSRVRSMQADKSDDSTIKKITEKDCRIQTLEKKVTQLELTIDCMNQEKAKKDEILQQINKEKELLEKNLDRLKFVANQNKKLVREKAEGFNSNGSELMQLRAQISQLSTKKRVSCSEIGINTDSLQEKNPEEEIQQPTQSLPNPQQDPTLQIYLHKFHKILQPLQNKLTSYQQTIYEQQKQLNEFYEQKQQNGSCRPTISTEEYLLQEMRINQQLREKMEKMEKECLELREELWEKDRDIEKFQLESKVKEIFKAHQLEIIHEKQGKQSAIEVNRLKIQVQGLQFKLNEREVSIKQLQSKISQQEIIIRSYQQRKSKPIVK